MRTLLAVIVAIIMTVTVGISFVIMRPVQYRLFDSLNATVYDISITSLTDSWDTLFTTVEYLWWIIPLGVAIIYILYVWMTAQEKEYVTTGVYR